MTFHLHAQLERETFAVVDLPLTTVRAMNDANYPWLVLVPRRTARDGGELRELIDLSDADAAALSAEIRRASRALANEFHPTKLNVAALGNVVPQLHVHVIARRADDRAWPRPVWGVVPAIAYAPEESAAFADRMRRAIESA